jgi:hypothetical protein
MANTKISQLPSYTGSAADLRWFVMNDSAETTTFKFSGYTSGLINGTGADSIISAPWLSQNYGGAQSNGVGSTAIGTRAEANAGQSTAYGWTCKANNDVATALGVSATASGLASIAVGYSITASNSYAIVVGAESAASGNQSLAIGRFASAQNTNTIAIGSNTTAETEGSTCVGNVMLIRQSTFSSTVGGSNNVINTTAGYNYNNIFGGINNNINGATSGATLVGCSGRTANASDATFVENLHIYRTPSTQVQPVSSGTTFTCNLDNGAKSQFYITGTSTINITNVRDGASFMIKTQTDGNYNMTWTATGGYTFVFEGGIKDPGNTTTDIFVFEVFGSVIYGNRRHNYS